jgi:hypothetical protein
VHQNASFELSNIPIQRFSFVGLWVFAIFQTPGSRGKTEKNYLEKNIFSFLMALEALSG